MTPRRRIGTIAALLLKIAAGVVDGLQGLISLLVFIPLVGIPLAFMLGKVVDISAFLLFGFWFSGLGICLFQEYPLEFIGTIVLEEIPIINIIPTWLIFVRYIIARERSKDTSPASGGV